jgi:hypothetical protein
MAGMLGLVAVFCINSAIGQVIHFGSNNNSGNTSTAVAANDNGGTPFVAEDSAAPASPASATGSNCGICNCSSGCGCSNGCGCGCGCGKADCDECPGYGIELFSGVEAWRNVATGRLQDSAGPVAGGNIGVPIPWLRDYGFGAQLGARFSADYLDGRYNSTDPYSNDSSETERQVFITAGIFRKAFDGESFTSRFNMGIAYDLMLSDGYGFWEDSPTLGQWRGQIGYTLDACNEVGVGGTLRDRSAEFDHNGNTYLYRPINQVNLFWHHNFASGANSWLSIGVPEQDRVVAPGNPPNGSLGDWTLGATLLVPISQKWAMYGDAHYMHPSASAGDAGGIECAYSVSFGVAFYPGGNARTRTVAGNCWMPYLPVANNGTFLVDTNSPFLQ